MFRLSQPEWLLLLPLLAVAVYAWPSILRAKRRWLRLALLLLLVFALTRPEIRLLREGLDLWLIVDRSESASPALLRQLPEWEAIIERHRGAHDRVLGVDYASEAVLRDSSAGITLAGSREETRTAEAIRYALSKADHDRAVRFLLFTDGHSTESLSPIAELLRRQGVALDYRLLMNDASGDFQVETLRLPSKAAPGEAFLLEFSVTGPSASPIPYRILRDGQLLAQGTTEIPLGQQRVIVRVMDRIANAGGHHYTVAITPENDPQQGNNQMEHWVEITGGPRVLVVTSYSGEDDPVVQALRSQHFEVEVVSDPSVLSEGSLQGARLVILNNIPAYHLPNQFLNAIDFFVREQGGGLLMTGGHQSFAKGGYAGSAIDELLPVSMQLKNDHRKLGAAIAIAMDRSGSMTASVGAQTKMDLANAGAARAVELLGSSDLVTVFAVDTEPHRIIPLSRVGGEAGKLAQTIRGIRSAGGGIFVGVALKAAINELESSPYQTRHVILFADARDSTNPDNYQELLQAFTNVGGTVSVIGLGEETDGDAPLLKEIAQLGNGRVFFSSSGSEVPALFEQETVAVARSAFIEEPTKVASTGTWQELAAQSLEWPANVDGYNLSYLRPDATAALLTDQDEPAPLVAFWQRGSGRVAAVSFPLGGAFSESVRGWRGYSDFVQTLTRWLQGESAPPGVGLRSRLIGTSLSVDLFFDPSWEATFAQTPPRLVIAGEAGASPSELVWQRMEPGLYRTTHALIPGQLIRGALQIGQHVLPFGPMQAGKGVEWERRPDRIAELNAIAKESRGQERVNLATVWDAPRAKRFREITPWLLGAVLVGFLVETLLSRWSLYGGKPIQKATGTASRKRWRGHRSKATTPSTPAPEAVAPPEAVETAEAAQPTTPSRRERFNRARLRR